MAKVASDDPVSASSNGQSGLRENGDIYASASQRFEHDAGLTLAGNVLSHSFTIANSWGGDVSVRDEEDDIIVNCGCTKFSLAKYQLAPGESTTVDVSLDTARRSGAINKGGEIIWTAADGTRYSTKFAIACEVRSAFEAEPRALSFGAEDVKQRAVKEIRLTSRFPINWKSVTASSGSEAFRVMECEAFAGDAKCRVACVAGGDVEAAQAVLRIAARGLSHEEGALTTEVPLRFHQVLALVAYPPLASLQRTADGSGTTKLLLRGASLKSGRISSVSADRCEVEWSWRPAAMSAADMGFLHVRLRLDSCDFSYTSPDEPGAPVVPACVCNAGSICANNQPQVICSG